MDTFYPHPAHEMRHFRLKKDLNSYLFPLLFPFFLAFSFELDLYRRVKPGLKTVSLIGLLYTYCAPPSYFLACSRNGPF